MIDSPFFAPAAVFLIGSCVGSFLNVCIHRIPQSLSIVRPASMCPGCGTSIRFYDNIPVLSYIMLAGKCRKCKMPISPRYPLVEILTGLFAVAVFVRFGPTAETAIYFLFICALLTVAFIDIDHRIIPDLISLPGIVIFFFCSFAIDSITAIDSLLGILSGGGALYIIARLWSLLRNIEAMGMGDVKLLAMIGALVGWKGVLFTIFVSSASGALVGLPLMLIKGNDLKMEVPFGPFLAAGAVVHVFFGPQIMDWYLHQY